MQHKDSEPAGLAVLADELELKRFQAAILAQTTRELVGGGEPRELTETFLLTCMGAVGASMGFCMVLDPGDPAGEHAQLTTRGLGSESLERLQSGMRNLVSALPAPPADMQGGASQIVIHDAHQAGPIFPEDTALVLGWKSPSGRSGFFGLGRNLDRQSYDQETIDFLQNLLHIFIQVLDNSCFTKTVTYLNQELQSNNQALQHALQRAKRSQADLDRRIFHLRALYDAATELSPLRDAEAILDTFLLLLLGSLSVESGCLMLYDSAVDAVSFHARGLPLRDQNFPQAQAKELLFKCIGASSFQQLTPLSTQLLAPASLEGVPLPLQHPSRVVLMRVDEQSLGLLLLGQSIAAHELSPEEDDILLNLTHNAMLFLRNARSFATIQALNKDLHERNQELEKTLAELTASRSYIEVLEHAGARLRTVLQHQAAQLGRVHLKDFIWIIVASLIFGIVFNMNNPNGVELVPRLLRTKGTERITIPQAMELLQREDAIFLDARPTALYDQSHAVGSINIPPSLFDFIYSMRFASLDHDPLFIVYGRTLSSLYDEDIAQRLRSQGHGNVLIVVGDLESWKHSGGQIKKN